MPARGRKQSYADVDLVEDRMSDFDKSPDDHLGRLSTFT